MDNIVFSLEEKGVNENNILLGEDDLNTLFASDMFPDSNDAVVLEHYYKKN